MGAAGFSPAPPLPLSPSVLPRLLLIGVASLVLVACNPRRAAQAEAPAAAEAPAVQQSVKVRAVEVQQGTLTTTRTTGVTLSPARESQVAATASGRVLEVLVQEGSRVEANQAVIRLDNANAQTALQNAQLGVQTARVNLERAQRQTSGSLAPLQASLEAAQANLSAAQRRYTEGQQLFKAGAISQVDLTNLEAALNQAQAGADNARESLARAGRAQREDLALLRLQIQQAENQLAQARRSVGDGTIRAPYAGVMVESFVNPGEFVNIGTRAFRLADTSRIEASFRLTPEDAGGLPIDSRVNVIFGGKTFGARVIRSARVPGTDRLVEIVARVNGVLPPGGNAQVNYTLTLARGVLVPSGALQTEGRNTYVYVIRDGKAARAAVQVLGDTGSRAAITGLNAGSQVVFPVPVSLNAGNAVEVVQ
ncbi:MAG: efflux RND transporter periplasmic adaptor subunit [Meiothermus sp.]|nr:efflux RND transporter periplasmic adaptor subunit [Meiothermus sp.]